MHICLKTTQIEDGTRKACRNCKTEYMRRYRADGRYKEKNREHYLKTKKWPMTCAKTAVFLEVRAGQMPHPGTLKCVDCSNMAQVYDHRDYLRSMDVQPVCRSCNALRGPGKNKKGRYIADQI